MSGSPNTPKRTKPANATPASASAQEYKRPRQEGSLNTLVVSVAIRLWHGVSCLLAELFYVNIFSFFVCLFTYSCISYVFGISPMLLGVLVCASVCEQSSNHADVLQFSNSHQDDAILQLVVVAQTPW